MQERNLKQVDILNLAEPYCKKYDIKLTKVDLSKYVSGKVEPGQAKLFILAAALNVSEAWLMGLDVPSTPTNLSHLDAELYSIEDDLKTFDMRIAFYSNFRQVLNILGYALSTNWKVDSRGNTIDLLEDINYKIEVPHSEIKELMDSSRSFIDFQVKQLFINYKKEPRNKEFDDMTDEEFEKYFSDESDNANVQDQTSCTALPMIHFTDIKEAKAFLKSQNILAAWKNGALSDEDILNMANAIWNERN